MARISQQVARQDEQMRQLGANNIALVAQHSGVNGEVTTIKEDVASLKTAQQQQPVQPPPIHDRTTSTPAYGSNVSGAGAETAALTPSEAQEAEQRR